MSPDPIVHVPERMPNLVELAPFTSDLDLQHSGDDTLNGEIQTAIDATIPEAAWCRWSVIGRRAAAVASRRRSTSAYIPLRGIVFDSWREAPIDERALEDLRRLRVSIIPNPAFSDSPWRTGRLDLEVFSLMMALNAAADLATISGRAVTVETEPLFEMLRRFNDSDDGQVLSETPRLRRRAYYLSAPLVARGPQLSEQLAGVIPLIGQFTALARLPETGRAMVVSAALQDSAFRAPTEIGLTRDDGEAQAWDAAFDSADMRLDPVFEVGGVSDELPLRAGSAPSSGLAWDGRPREFLHLAWKADAEEGSAITAILLDHNNLPHLGAAVGGAFGSNGRWLRVDVGPALGAKGLRVLLLRGRAQKASEPEPERPPITGAPGIALEEPQYQTSEAWLIDETDGGKQDAPLTAWVGEGLAGYDKRRRAAPSQVQLLQYRSGEDGG